MGLVVASVARTECSCTTGADAPSAHASVQLLQAALKRQGALAKVNAEHKQYYGRISKLGKAVDKVRLRLWLRLRQWLQGAAGERTLG